MIRRVDVPLCVVDNRSVAIDLEVFIDSLDEQGRAAYISGYFEYRKTRLRFDAIGMEGYGGPNISATLSDETLGARTNGARA